MDLLLSRVEEGHPRGGAQVGTVLFRGSLCPPPPPGPILPWLCPRAGRARSLPGERVPGQGMRVLRAGTGRPSLKAVFIFKPLLPKCQLTLFFEISYSPRGHRALLKTLIKLFMGRNQIVGPGVSRFLESLVPNCVASLCRSSERGGEGTWPATEVLLVSFPSEIRSVFQNHAPQSS